MGTPLQVTFRHIDASEALEARVRELTEKLEHVFARLTRCFVLIEGPSAHHEKGDPFRVRIELGLARHDIIANGADTDAYRAVAQAFERAQKQLQHLVKKTSEHKGAPA
jgi:ribosomal subunit interface protein